MLAAVAGFVYLLVAGDLRFDFRQSPHPHHILLADAFLHGQAHVRPDRLAALCARDAREISGALNGLAQRGRPISDEQRRVETERFQRGRALLDWSVVDGRYYGYWGPFVPAVLTPVVALCGPDVSDRLLDALFGALNVGLFYALLRRAGRAGLCPTTEAARIGLTLVLAFGTVHFYSACIGSVWFSVQVITLTAVLVSLLLACAPNISKRTALAAGVAFGAALLGRNIVILVGLFFPVLFWLRVAGQGGRLKAWLARCLCFAAPCVAAVLVQGAYNQARFGTPFDSGQDALMHSGGAAALVPDYERYGQLHPHFLVRNFKFYFWNWELPRDTEGRLKFDGRGNSMFLVTPPLLYTLLAMRRRNWFALALACGAVPFIAGLLLFRTTGAYQFGNRYLLEVLPLLLMLAAEGMRGRLTAISYVLIVAAVTANLFGTYRFCTSSFVGVENYAPAALVAFVAVALLASAAAWIVQLRCPRSVVPAVRANRRARK